MAVKYVLIFILSSANPTEQHVAQAWDKLFPSYDDCLKQASTLEPQNAVLKDCKTVEVPGEGPPKEDVLLTPEASVLEEPDQTAAPALPPQNEQPSLASDFGQQFGTRKWLTFGGSEAVRMVDRNEALIPDWTPHPASSTMPSELHRGSHGSTGA